LPVADTQLGAIGLCVCYDLRFVEVARLLALQGASLIAVPTAWVGGFDQRAHDKEGFISQARGAVLQANLNQVYIACASQSGSVGEHRFLGNSLIADPFGAVLSGPMDDAGSEILVADYDAAVASAAQHRSALINPREDRRTDVYGVRLRDRVL
jgi:N-carbamoylputrescine amidase